MSKSSRSSARQQASPAGAPNQDAETDEPPAVIIAAALDVERYEIASYGVLCAWGDQMGHRDAVSLFQESLEEEKAADEKPTTTAETAANEGPTPKNDLAA